MFRLRKSPCPEAVRILGFELLLGRELMNAADEGDGKVKCTNAMMGRCFVGALLMGQVLLLSGCRGVLPATDETADAVFFAQTHVQQADHPYFKLVGGRKALLKVHVVSPSQPASPPVTATLSVGGAHTKLVLRGPDKLPASISIEPGVVEHRFDDSFTVMIPKEWIRPGLKITVTAGAQEKVIDDIKVGAPAVVHTTMFDIHYFQYEEADYEPGWKEAIEVKWPVVEWKIQRIPNIIFEELVVPPRPNAGLPAVRCSKPEDYLEKTGKPFDGEQATARQWRGALQHAGGQSRIAIYFVNIYNVHAGGEAWNFGGVGRVGRLGILHHELGHAFCLPHWSNDPKYPYRDTIHGIVGSGVHVGPTWGFDHRIGRPGAPEGMPRFVSPIVQEGALQGKVGQWKHDLMQGGMNDADPGFMLRMFSDYSVFKIQEYLENHMAVWDEDSEKYATWDKEAKAYSKMLEGNGVSLPIESKVDVISVMAAVSAVTPEAILIYEPIGPYVAGLIQLFDPSVAEDRARADAVYCPDGGCDVSLRVEQGGKTKTYMMPVAWRADRNPIATDSISTRAINLPARDGEISKIEMLLTPDAEKNGLPAEPKVLDTWTNDKWVK
jgi:hypothetical protein